ncbi:uncharacterized protein LOC126403807 isoform X1 [Epinephelus moara]|uniref:uncharacterized protein LOC126403807 isoform X1 n=1 Tax=Epinephelus moara TaxID=300413 RepID=UPI00214F37B0|nr:uncharacterized protein LOC126403807 isoform X1 [Epinephelus moara]
MGNFFTTTQTDVSGQEKCYDPGDTTLTFVDGDDDLDFLCDDFKSLRAKMSCGHAVTPMSLTNHCRRLLDEGECRFVCGLPRCDVEWTYEEVRKMALLTSEEMDYFEMKMFSNYKHHLDAKSVLEAYGGGLGALVVVSPFVCCATPGFHLVSPLCVCVRE